jgi:hypothetical protein
MAAALACPAFAQDSSNSDAPPGPPPGGGHHGGPGMLTKDEMDELHSAHDAALQANPDLATEEKDLKAKMDAFHKKMDAAMIAADPKVEPIIQKMDAARERHEAGEDGPPPPPPGQ